MPFIPDVSVLAAYSLACFVLFITPGPDMSLQLAKTLAGGRRAGIAAATGASLGIIVHSLLAAFGLSALVAASPSAKVRQNDIVVVPPAATEREEPLRMASTASQRR